MTTVQVSQIKERLLELYPDMSKSDMKKLFDHHVTKIKSTQQKTATKKTTATAVEKKSATIGSRCIGILQSGPDKGQQCRYNAKGKVDAKDAIDKCLCGSHRRARRAEWKKGEHFHTMGY